MKKHTKILLTTTSCLFALAAFAQDFDNISWTDISANEGNTIYPASGVNYKVTGNNASGKNNTEWAKKVAAENADYLWFYSGTAKNDVSSSYNQQVSKSEGGDVRGAKYLTILGNPEDGSGPSVTGKVRGSALQEDKDAYFYIYGGRYNDNVSAVSFNTAYNSKVGYEGTPINTTGHLIISGGDYSGDITGFGMASEGNFTANTDVQIIGKITNAKGMGVYGGVAGQTKGAANLYGNTNVSVSGEGQTSFVVGGNRMASSLTGNASVSVVDGGTVGAILGGTMGTVNVNNSKAIVDGNINVSVKNGNVGTISSTGISNFEFNGIIGGGINTSVTGTVKVDITGNSTVKGGVTAGSLGWGTTSIGKTELNISGGNITSSGKTTLENVTVNNAIYAGSLAIGVNKKGFSIGSYVITEGVQSAADVTVANGSSVNISGGNINGSIYAGGYAQGANSTYNAKLVINNGSNITVDASENTVAINGDIYGGGYAENSYSTATVNDGTNIVFKGNGENLAFDGTVYAGGAGSGNVAVNGDKVFSFGDATTGYNGHFNGSLSGFDTVKVAETSNVRWTNFTSDKLVNSNGSTTVTNAGKMEILLSTSMADGSSLNFTATDVSNLAVFGGYYDTANNMIVKGSTNADIKFDATGSTNISAPIAVSKTENTSIAIEAADSSNTQLELSFNVQSDAGTVVNSFSMSSKESVAELVKIGTAIVENFQVYAAYDFDIELGAGDTVVISALINELDFSNGVSIWHKADGENWKNETDNVGLITYEDGKLMFEVGSFSEWAVSSFAPNVPEPSTYAAIFGALALGFVIYRRRK